MRMRVLLLALPWERQAHLHDELTWAFVAEGRCQRTVYRKYIEWETEEGLLLDLRLPAAKSSGKYQQIISVAPLPCCRQWDGQIHRYKGICDYFERIRKCDTFLVIAPTGIAASNICGNTLHLVCGFVFARTQRNPASHKHGLQERWSNIAYAIIDQGSVVGQKKLARFHEYLLFIQLPPVQYPALYAPNKISRVDSSLDNSPDSPGQPEAREGSAKITHRQ